MLDAELRERADAWLADDPDPATRRMLRTWLDASEEAPLREAFAEPLRFGTAGLRGLMGPGPARMNRLVVARTTAGLLRVLRDEVPRAAERGVVLAFDGRRCSREFAEEAAALACGAGFHVHLFEEPTPTPLAAFACLHLGTAAAVVVTASHNPPEYNGYKVFWADGAQIVPPLDAHVAARIAEVGPYARLPRIPLPRAREQGLLRSPGVSVTEAYLRGIQSQRVHPPRTAPLRIAYTALHGVGQPLALAAMEAAAEATIHPVPEQSEPDGTFPTVRFPNPEEPGAMDRVRTLADRVGADLALANDPDADRLAVHARDRRGRLLALSGDEVGSILADYLLRHRGGEGALLVNTLVSSPLLGDLAEEHGARWERTLTGFKWIQHRALELERSEGLRLLLGYEEALGYSVGTLVRDKDGIGAAAAIVECAAELKAEGRTLHDALADIWRRHGVLATAQRALVRPGLQGRRWIDTAVERLFSAHPTRLAEYPVTAVLDLRAGVRRGADGSCAPLPWPRTRLILFELRGGHAVMARPSGTEPKLKLYAHARVGAERAARDVETAKREARAIALTLLDAVESLTES